MFRLVAIALALVVAAACADSSRSGSPSPSASPTKPVAEIARLSGVGVTWLPPHFTAEGADVTPVAHGSQATQDFRGNAQDPDQPAPRLSLRVERGGSLAFDLARQKDVRPTSTTIRGHAGLLASLPADGTPAFPAPTYYLQWLEQPGLTLTVSASFGATASDAKRLAAGLVIHPMDASLPTAADQADVRTAFITKFTPLSGEVTVREIRFSDATHASATVSLAHRGAGGADITTGQSAVKVGGHWEVSQHGYCMIMKITGTGCPAT